MNILPFKGYQGYNSFSVPSVKRSTTGLYVFESPVTKNQRKLVLCLCQLLPQPCENFPITQGLCPSGPKKQSNYENIKLFLRYFQRYFCSNYIGISIKKFCWERCILLELIKVRKVDCSNRSKPKFLKIKLSLFSNRKIFKSNIFLLKILSFR